MALPKEINIADLTDEEILLLKPLCEDWKFMKVELKKLREDISKNGTVEMFSQSESQTPYERERPTVRQYVSMNTTFQKLTKQINDILGVKDKAAASVDINEEVLRFIDAKG